MGVGTERWQLEDDCAIVWNVARDARLPHDDHLEMSGRLVATIVRYGVGADGTLSLRQCVVWPTLRTIPNDTHASLRREYDMAALPGLRADGRPLGPGRVTRVRFDGTLAIDCDLGEGLSVERTLYPTTTHRAVVEKLLVRNRGARSVTVEVEPYERVDGASGVYGDYVLEVATEGPRAFTLDPGEERSLAVVISGRLAAEPPPELVPAREEEARRRYVAGLTGSLRLETPNPVLDRAFALAKVRAAESIFATKGGLMHAPGGERYYAAIWANDQAEYAGPFFPFLGDAGGNESTLTCYRMFARYVNPEYRPIPSSIIAEGTDTWAGAGDRGDAAMVAYGAARYALARGDRGEAEELWPLIEWCLEYCRRQITADGVIASDRDELEGRFPTGDANLCTSCLTYDALLSAALLARELGLPEALAGGYEQWAGALREAIERHFGGEVEGFDTYRYYAGNTVLRAWICVPLAMGIHDRADATVAALFSPRLWSEDGLATQAGEITFWDRSTLYALRGVLAAGKTELGMGYLTAYVGRRLLGDHVPYAVEAYPEGGQAQLSAESALLCRTFTEGLFGIRPVGLRRFTCAPRLPEGWERMALRDVRAFGARFDLVAERAPEGTRVTVEADGVECFRALWAGDVPLEVRLPE